MTKSRFSVGVDPGLRGAVAIVEDGELVDVVDMPSVKANTRGNDLDLSRLASELDGLFTDAGNINAWIERVGARPGQGVSSMFKFGRTVGAVEGILAAHFARRQYVTPNVWKKHFRLPSEKDAARLMAAQLWPKQASLFSRVKDDGRAEAALIAMYGWEQTK